MKRRSATSKQKKYTRRVKNNKNEIGRYTAFIPKTLKATRGIGINIKNQIQNILKTGKNKIIKTTKNLNRVTSKKMRSLTRKLRN